MTVYNYAEQFEQALHQKYAKELASVDLFNSNPHVKFINAQTIKLPNITVSGYKDHNRQTIGFNSGTISNEWEPKKLEHDRDIEFAIDPMDVDTTTLTAENILQKFDDAMEKMDEAGVPSEGRILYVTPAVNKLFKQAKDIQRVLGVNGSNGDVKRSIYSLDDVKIKQVQSARMKSQYNFTNGCVATDEAKQMNFILIHPSCEVAREKYSYIKVFTPGHDSRTADNYLLQSRFYMDAFLIKNKAAGIFINATA